MLSCRLPGLENRAPVCVVSGLHLRPLVASQLVGSADQHPVWLFTTAKGTAGKAALAAGGAVLQLLPPADQREQVAALLAILAEQGITRLLVEGETSLATAFLRAGIIDRIHLLDAPISIGADRTPAVDLLDVRRLRDARCWHQIEARPLGGDRLLILEPV